MPCACLAVRSTMTIRPVGIPASPVFAANDGADIKTKPFASLGESMLTFPISAPSAANSYRRGQVNFVKFKALGRFESYKTNPTASVPSYPAYRNQSECPEWLYKDAIFDELGSGQPTRAYGRFVEQGEVLCKKSLASCAWK